METTKERTKLIAARLAYRPKLTQAALAKAIGASRDSVGSWERGEVDPHPDMVIALCRFFNKEPYELDLAPVPVITVQNREGELAMLQKILSGMQIDRREALELVKQVPALAAFVEILALPETKGIVAPETFLKYCRASINGCWDLLSSGGFAVAENILNECIPTLSTMAEKRSSYQHQAALLAVEANIILMAIATHRLDYGARELFGLEAVRLGELSRDGSIHAMALSWHGNTYESSLHLPKTAIAVYESALPHLGSNTLLSKADICIGLAEAYALNENEIKARDYAELAKTTMPDDPEFDPLYRCIRMGQAEMNHREGCMYLTLAKHFPSEGHAQRAYDTFNRSTDHHALSALHRGIALIHKADAAIGIGERDEYINCLEEGARISLQVGSKNRIHKARLALRKAPESWQKEKGYQEIVKLLKNGGK